MLSRVLVTGATGFVGSRLVSRLTAAGTHVTALSRNPPDEECCGPIRWIRGDVTEPSTYRAAVREVDGVVHLAACLSARKISDYEHANVLGTACLLETCAEECPGVKRVVVVSSVAAMGPSRDGRPLRELDPCRPVSEYGASKLRAEREALSLAGRVPITVLRPVFVYGSGDARGASHLESWLRSPLGAWKSPIRALSLVHVDDLCLACEKALTADLPSGTTLLVAAPPACNWNDIRAAVSSAFATLATEGSIEPRLARRLAGRIEALEPETETRSPAEWWTCDVGRASSLLGFVGTQTLVDGVRETIASYAARGFFAPERWPVEPTPHLETSVKPARPRIRQEAT